MATKKDVSTPEATADQLKDPMDQKPKQLTAKEARDKLAALEPVAKERMLRIRDLEVKLQKARTLLKSEGTPGMTMNQDHFRMKGMIEDLRKLLDVTPEQIGG
ncbi:hypothetical protein SEA_JACOREN57_36 [Mycobacterium phage JacoRen57]|nr:hypothetical protein SEA_JACOREN57_36 [Mycobacterium phage JacoRen57]